jgi:PilZ domain-containing protein
MNSLLRQLFPALPELPELRIAPREVLPGLAAYFFTDGIPEAHYVRDISRTGIYVYTTERWKPGTLVRMTLIDRCRLSVERSINLYATVVRWGSDGDGLEFNIHNDNIRRKRQTDGTADGADRMQIDRFIRRLRRT